MAENKGLTLLNNFEKSKLKSNILFNGVDKIKKVAYI